MFIRYLFTMKFRQLYNEMSQLLSIDVPTIYEYLSITCNWRKNYQTYEYFMEHIRNNSDKVESGHAIAGFIISRAHLLNDGKLKNKMMAMDNNIIEFLIGLYRDPTKHELLFRLFDRCDKVNVAKKRRESRANIETVEQKAHGYLQGILKQSKLPTRSNKRKHKEIEERIELNGFGSVEDQQSEMRQMEQLLFP